MVKFHLTSITNICITMVLEEDNTLYCWSLSFHPDNSRVLLKLSHKGWNLYSKFLR